MSNRGAGARLPSEAIAQSYRISISHCGAGGACPPEPLHKATGYRRAAVAQEGERIAPASQMFAGVINLSRLKPGEGYPFSVSRVAGCSGS